MVTALVHAGADLEARDSIKRTPLHWMIEINKSATAAEALLGAGADPRARDDNGGTPRDLVKHWVSTKATESATPDHWWRVLSRLRDGQ